MSKSLYIPILLTTWTCGRTQPRFDQILFSPLYVQSLDEQNMVSAVKKRNIGAPSKAAAGLVMFFYCFFQGETVSDQIHDSLRGKKTFLTIFVQDLTDVFFACSTRGH